MRGIPLQARKENLPQNWAIGFAVEGDLRFLSHHDTMRAVERTALRAKCPLRFSQGFNPRPSLSLPCPRPVGVASLDDIVVLTLEDSPVEIDTGQLAQAFNGACPKGMRFFDARKLAQKTLHPRKANYELELDAARAQGLASRLAELSSQETWEVDRQTGEDKASRRIDLRPLLPTVALEGQTLRWKQTPLGQTWAKPSEVLGLLGLDGQFDLAGVVRTAVEFE